MKLSNAAKFFDKQSCYDAFDLSVDPVYGQLDLFDDSKRDGSTGLRRVFSVAADVILPASGAITIANHVFIVGGEHEDTWQNSVIRRKHVVQQAEGTAAILTLAEACAAAAGVATWASKVWIKDLKEVEQSTSLHPFYNIVFPVSVAPAKNQVVRLGGILYLTRTLYLSAGGFTTAECNELTGVQPQNITYTDKSGQAYNPVLDTYTGLAPVVAAGLLMRYEDHYVKLSSQAEKNLPGDMCLVMPRASLPSPAAGDEFTTADGTAYRVVEAYNDDATAWLLHSRLA